MTPADLQAARELAQSLDSKYGALVSRLADEVEALRKDAERMDWAEQQWNEVLIAGLFCDWEFDGKRYPTGARAAIDAAIKGPSNG